MVRSIDSLFNEDKVNILQWERRLVGSICMERDNTQRENILISS